MPPICLISLSSAQADLFSSNREQPVAANCRNCRRSCGGQRVCMCMKSQDRPLPTAHPVRLRPPTCPHAPSQPQAPDPTHTKSPGSPSPHSLSHLQRLLLLRVPHARLRLALQHRLREGGGAVAHGLRQVLVNEDAAAVLAAHHVHLHTHGLDECVRAMARGDGAGQARWQL
jgi:hypothetical protein